MQTVAASIRRSSALRVDRPFHLNLSPIRWRPLMLRCEPCPGACSTHLRKLRIIPPRNTNSPQSEKCDGGRTHRDRGETGSCCRRILSTAADSRPYSSPDFSPQSTAATSGAESPGCTRSALLNIPPGMPASACAACTLHRQPLTPPRDDPVSLSQMLKGRHRFAKRVHVERSDRVTHDLPQQGAYVDAPSARRRCSASIRRRALSAQV